MTNSYFVLYFEDKMKRIYLKIIEAHIIDLPALFYTDLFIFFY